jgi:hypothetical protein
MTSGSQRRLPVGADVVAGGVHFRVWAPRRRPVAVVSEGGSGQAVPLEAEDSGYFSGRLAIAPSLLRCGIARTPAGLHCMQCRHCMQRVQRCNDQQLSPDPNTSGSSPAAPGTAPMTGRLGPAQAAADLLRPGA